MAQAEHIELLSGLRSDCMGCGVWERSYYLCLAAGTAFTKLDARQ